MHYSIGLAEFHLENDKCIEEMSFYNNVIQLLLI